METHLDDRALIELARRIAGANRAEDLAQEVRIALMRRPPEGNVRAWVIAVLKNLTRQARRGEARRHRRELAAARPEVVAPPVDGHEVRTAVGSLPEPYRSTVTMRYFDGLSSADIAQRQAVPASTTRNRLRRALLLLRGMLCLPLLALARPKYAAAGLIVACGCLAYAGDESTLPPMSTPSATPTVSPPSPRSPREEERHSRTRTSPVPKTSPAGSGDKIEL